jgi:uncharacterized protein (TIGR02099 family)
VKNSFAHILNKLWYMIAAVIILAALLVSIARLLTPVLNEHRTDFEKIASNILNMPVMIHSVEVTWHGYAPEISLKDVTVLDPETQNPKLAMQRFDVDFSIWRSLWARTAFVQSITISGVELAVTHTEDELQIGDLAKLNIKDALTGATVGADTVVEWVFSQPRLALENIQLHYTGHKAEHFVTLKKLTLQNTPTHHILAGRATLNQDLPTKVDIHLSWDGDVRKLTEAKAQLYFYFEGLSLQQWFSKQTWHGLNLTQGLASTKVWIHWENNQVNKFQSEFEVYGLTLYSAAQKRLETINRMSAVIGWKRDGKLQTFAGDKILVDFSDHLWPATSFSIKGAEDDSGKLAINNVQFSYANLADLARLVLDTDFLSADQRQTLMTFNPNGEIVDLTATLPAELSDIQHLLLAGKWVNLSIAPYQQYPGVNNFSGSLNWNGRIAAINLNTKNVTITANRIFAKPVYFNNLTGDLQLTHDADGRWLYDTRNLHVDTVDAAVNTQVVLIVPQTGSQTIDLVANFKVMNAGHIVNYLPVKTFDPDLAAWLQAAFLSGQIDTGKAIVHGDLKDFPFDATQGSTGKFLITSTIKNMEFNYGPGWPHIQHLNGQLTFAGSAMTADVSSGRILNVPISNVRGVIPYIGESGPQILHVDGMIHGDLAQGLDFIQKSPLQKTVGKDLVAMKLTGPMQLKLGLVVPLGKPDNTTVSGDVTVVNAKLMLPEWNLSLDKMNGGFNFTEQGIEAKNLQGELFGEPTTLQMTTIHDASKIGLVRADVASKISIASLQKWLGMNFSDVATGATPFQLQLYLSQHSDVRRSSDRIVINSTLEGIALNLPRPYAKTADKVKDFQTALDLNDSKFIKTQSSYAKSLTAALTYQKTKQGFQLYGGEIHLGPEQPSSQQATGILLTGNVTEFKVSDWQDYITSLQKNAKPGQQFDTKMLRGINLHAGVITVLGTELHRADVRVVPKNNAWQIDVNSNELDGDVSLPFKLDGQVVEGHFKYLHIGSAIATTAKDNSQRVDPRSVPSLRLDVDDVSYKDMKFGHVSVELVPSKSGLVIKQLRIDEPTLQLDASGEWTQSGKRYNSHLHGSMNAPHIGDVLTQWGFNSSNLVGSTGDVKFDLSWPDAPYQPSIASLSGTLSLKLGEGRIVHLSESTNSKMGLGRMLNVLSLSTIPRRLSLNFTDLFEQGYSFDSMKGDFSFKNANAYIDSMRFEGPVAGVNLKGRIGIAAKDFDLQMGVTPHVTGSLPIVAAIAGGPVVGVATWVVDRVVAHEVAKSSTYEYSVTGSWDHPVWKKLNEDNASVSN